MKKAFFYNVKAGGSKLSKYIVNTKVINIKHTCPSLTIGPSLQPSSKGSEILMFLAHCTSIFTNFVAILS